MVSRAEVSSMVCISCSISSSKRLSISTSRVDISQISDPEDLRDLRAKAAPMAAMLIAAVASKMFNSPSTSLSTNVLPSASSSS